VAVVDGDPCSFTITPNPGYIVADVQSAGVSIGGLTSFTYYRINGDCTLSATMLAAPNSTPETIYVDCNLPNNITDGTYSIANRSGGGSDGNAYKTIGEACYVTGAGDTVYIRGGMYNKLYGAGLPGDTLWPRVSGTASYPITFKNYNGESVLIGYTSAPGGDFPTDYLYSIARAPISMRAVQYININGITVQYTGAWLYARDCNYITVENCNFLNSVNLSGKACARFFDSSYCTIKNCLFWNSGNDPSSLNYGSDCFAMYHCDHFLVEDNTFHKAAHSVVSVKGSSWNVFRNNVFRNPWYINGYAEKLIEVYDIKINSGSDPRGATFMPFAYYNSTQHNIFEGNWFGYHPDYDPSLNKGSRCSAIQFSGQKTIIRRNIFSNPTLSPSDPNGGVAGGVGINWRWGGSWTGWNASKGTLIGEAIEAGYVWGNRVYNNVFYGNDGSQMTLPVNDALSGVPNPPPLKNVQDYTNYPFTDYFRFDDNIIINNVLAGCRFVNHRPGWTPTETCSGNPIQLFIMGRRAVTIFKNNLFDISDPNRDNIIFDYPDYGYNLRPLSYYQTNLSANFIGNIQAVPQFISLPLGTLTLSGDGNFRLRPESACIDGGTFLTTIRTAAGSGTSFTVEDPNYFYDGYGISGEQGDLIKLGNGQIARINSINYTNGSMILDRVISWSDGEKVALDYDGSAPDIGAYEYTLSVVNDLAVSDVSQNSVTVIWTLPGDVEQGLPARYDIRYSTSSLSEATWGAATQVQGEPVPGNYGIQQSFTITGLNSGTTYYIGIKTSNDTGSTTSSLSNVVLGITTTTGNHAPVLQITGDKSIAENEILTFVVNATDADPGDTLTYSATDIPAGAVFNPATRTFTWTPTSSQGGTYHVTFHVSDSLITVSETIRITVTGVQSTLAISSTSGGSVTSPGEGNFSYDDGTSVSVQATAVTNYHFVSWTGTAVNAGMVANPNAASTTVNVDADYTLQANFAVDQRTLTFSSTAGGSVTVPGEGNFPYDHGTFVAIRAIPVSNYSFVNWTGTAVNAGKVVNPNAASTTVTADANYTIQANFAQQDGSAPTVTNLSPSADDIQVPLNSLIILHVTDAGIGVDASSVSITLDGSTIYTGDTTTYSNPAGHCYRTGTPADYTYVYQSNQNFDFDQTKTVTVNASDLGGVIMTGQSYSFTTEMRSFGQNKQVDPIVEGLDEAGPSTARDTNGNIWVVWHTGPVGNRDIYIAKLAAGADAFGTSLPLISHSADQSNPAIAVGTDDRLYVVWQDNRQADGNLQGEWDIYISTSFDGATWSVETRVNDPNENNQTNPAIVVDSQSPNYTHVVWQDDRAGNQDICIASSNDGFATKTVSQITNDPSSQNEPVIGVDASNTVYVLWTDARNPMNGFDIYGAASNTGPWTNVPVVSKGADQSSPAIAVESIGSIMHMLWTDQTLGDSGIYYASSDGLPGSALIGSNLIDDYAKGNGQFSPAIAVTGNTGNDLKVFACWHDERDVSGSTGDTDIWFVRANYSSGTNVFVGDGGTSSNQIEPAMGIDQYGHPYVVWTDDRGANTEIYCAPSTYMKPTALALGRVTPTSLDVTIGTDPGAITDVDDFSIELLAGTCPYDVNITITEIANPPENALRYFLNGCDFGPSGIQFNVPVTITIPYAVTDTTGTPTAYWYNSRTGTLSQEGITNIEIIELSSSLHALRFDTTHLTPFFAMRGGVIGGGSGGGGCSLSRSQEGNIVEYFLPYGVLVLLMIVLKWRDRRHRAFSGKAPSK